MKQTIFGIILGLLLVLTVSVGFEIQEKYEIMNSSEYVAPTEFTVDIDGIKYRKNL
jgi:hypothetical protein